MVTVAFIRCFSCFSWFSYCRGNCICAGQGNTVVSHFVVQRGDFIFTVVIACVPCGPRRSLIYVWAWGFCVCWKLSAAEKVKPDCCRTPAVVSIFDRLRCLAHCPVLQHHHSITYIYACFVYSFNFVTINYIWSLFSECWCSAKVDFLLWCDHWPPLKRNLQ